MTDMRQSQRLDPMATRNTDWFWEEAAQGRLSIHRCTACDIFYHPPRPVCPQCHGTAMEPTPVSGRGTIYSFMRVSYPPPIGFDEPPLIALVELEEGEHIRLITNIVDAELADLSPDASVEVDIELTAKGKALPVFRLAKGASA